MFGWRSQYDTSISFSLQIVTGLLKVTMIYISSKHFILRRRIYLREMAIQNTQNRMSRSNERRIYTNAPNLANPNPQNFNRTP